MYVCMYVWKKQRLSYIFVYTFKQINLCVHISISRVNGFVKKWYQNQPELITEVKEATILWDLAFQTDRNIESSRPDIIAKDSERKMCLLIDMSVSIEQNVSQGVWWNN